MNSAFSPTTTIPPTMSECPFKYFVAECTTRSQPNVKGCWIQGVAKVLSSTVINLCWRAIFTTCCISTNFNKGLVGDSIHNNLVSGFICLIKLFKSVISTYEKLKLDDRCFIWLNKRTVPPYK